MKISTLWLGFGLCGLTTGAIVWAQNIRPPAMDKTTIKNATAVRGQEAAAIVATPAVKPSALKPLPLYDSTHLSASMFARPLPPEPKPAPPAPPAPPPPAPQPPPPPPDPLAGYVYTGTVTVGGIRLALLENKQMKTGQYVQIGDNFLGGRVAQIESGQITLQMNGANRMVPKSLAVNLVPLDKSAAFLGGGPNGPGGPGGMPNPGAPMPMMMGDNAAMMQAQMMQAQAEAMQSAMGQKMMMDLGGAPATLEFRMAK